MTHHHKPFYDIDILRDREEAYIESLMKKYKGQEPSEELKQKIWDELQMEKHLGNLTIPFKVNLKKDPNKVYKDQIEVLLDTKV